MILVIIIAVVVLAIGVFMHKEAIGSLENRIFELETKLECVEENAPHLFESQPSRDSNY